MYELRFSGAEMKMSASVKTNMRFFCIAFFLTRYRFPGRVPVFHRDFFFDEAQLPDWRIKQQM